MDLLEEFQRVVHALDRVGIEYALCGGLAVAVHGAPRATRDIDLLIREEDLESILELMRPLGFRFLANPMKFADGMRMHRVSRIEGRDVLMLDLLLVGTGTQEAWDSRHIRETSAGPISVIGREALIAMKVGSGRSQDLADVERLLNDDR